MVDAILSMSEYHRFSKGIFSWVGFNTKYIPYEVQERIADGLGIMLFDVDDFKIINDTKGHLAGDLVLKQVAKNISEVFCGQKYRVFRIGGDEFVLLFEQKQISGV